MRVQDKKIKYLPKAKMMNVLKNIGFLFLLTTLLFSSCRKDNEIQGSFPPDVPIPEVLVNGSFYGQVVDEANQAIENTIISVGTHTIETDENGFFYFNDIEINNKGSLVTAQRDGYFYNAKFVKSKLNTKNFVKIQMIKKNLTDSFAANAGGTVVSSGGASVEFSASSIKKESGGTYNGEVNVYVTWLDPTASDLIQRMPGDLRGINTNDEQQQLTTFGMIGVELESDAGEALNIAEGQTATIELPVPASLLANAPATIPLWHFEETTGYWIEEGEATLQGNKYVGTVSHFSFWNCDIPNTFVFIEGEVTDEAGQPIANVQIKITEVASGMVGYGRTDENGFYSGAVPNDQNLILTILNSCDEEIYSAPIGPFSADATIPSIIVFTNENFITLSGTLVDCNNDPVTNGYLKVDFAGRQALLYTDADGVFNDIISICDATSLDYTGYDLDNLKQSTRLTEVIDSTAIDLANVFVCEDLTEFMIFKIGDIEQIDTEPDAIFGSINGIPDYIRLFGSDPMGTIPWTNIFIPNALTAGVYIPEHMDVLYYDDSLQMAVSNVCDDMECNDVDFEFTTYEGIGGFVIGSFSGILEPKTLGVGTAKEFTGTFKILLR